MLSRCEPPSLNSRPSRDVTTARKPFVWGDRKSITYCHPIRAPRLSSQIERLVVSPLGRETCPLFFPKPREKVAFVHFDVRISCCWDLMHAEGSSISIMCAKFGCGGAQKEEVLSKFARQNGDLFRANCTVTYILNVSLVPSLVFKQIDTSVYFESFQCSIP